MAANPSEETLDALYNINKHARRYAELGTENYRKGKKTTAKANSNKKKALYTVKEHVLAEIHGAADRVEIHAIDGTDFYCLYFGKWSFHTPVDSLNIDGERVNGRRSLDEFEKTGEKVYSDRSLKECLLHIEAEFGINANEFLPDKYLQWGRNSHFIGWKYLGDG